MKQDKNLIRWCKSCNGVELHHPDLVFKGCRICGADGNIIRTLWAETKNGVVYELEFDLKDNKMKSRRLF